MLDLHITYLMGARMDRAIDATQPFTLQVVADILRSRWDAITLLDPHSPVSAELLDAAWALSPLRYVARAVEDLASPNLIIVAPDEGARERTADMAEMLHLPVLQCLKKRDMQTGALSGFEIEDPSLATHYVKGAELLIVDDLCDGGGTFSGLAQVLREAGAAKVHLYATHGIFSKGYSLSGIDRIFTTNSYKHFPESWNDKHFMAYDCTEGL